jgi:nicotinamidase-related amidase
MLNSLLNSVVLKLAKFQMRKYKHYPSDSTAVILVNVQDAFLTSPDLTEKLESLIELGRRHNFKIVHAPYSANSNNPFPTPAQTRMQQLLADKDDVNAPETLAPSSDDYIIQPRTTLSAFAGTDLDSRCKGLGVEHLIFAGPLANITLDSSARDGVELGYHVTILNDCTSAYTSKEKDFATNITFPRFAQTVMSLSDLQKFAAG